MHPETLDQYEKMKARGDGDAWALTVLAGPHHLHVPESINQLAYEITQSEYADDTNADVRAPTSVKPFARSFVLTVEQGPEVSCLIGFFQNGFLVVDSCVGGYCFPVGAISLADGGFRRPDLSGCSEIVRAGAVCLSEDERGLMLLRVAIILSLVNQPRFVQVDSQAGTRAHRRRVHKTTGLAASAWSTVSWKLGKGVAPKFVKEGEPGHHKALHWCRAHWRRAEPHRGKAELVTMPDGTNGWFTWVKDSWRGDPAYGVKLQRHEPFLSPADRGRNDCLKYVALPETRLEALSSAQRQALVEAGRVPSLTLH